MPDIRVADANAYSEKMTGGLSGDYKKPEHKPLLN